MRSPSGHINRFKGCNVATSVLEFLVCRKQLSQCPQTGQLGGKNDVHEDKHVAIIQSDTHGRICTRLDLDFARVHKGQLLVVVFASLLASP